MKTVMYVLYLFIGLSWLSVLASVCFACHANWGPAIYFLLAAHFTRGVLADAGESAMRKIQEAYEDGIEAGEIIDDL